MSVFDLEHTVFPQYTLGNVRVVVVAHPPPTSPSPPTHQETLIVNWKKFEWYPACPCVCVCFCMPLRAHERVCLSVCVSVSVGVSMCVLRIFYVVVNVLTCVCVCIN